MIKIAICDDENTILECMYKKIKETIDIIDKEVEIEQFIHGKELIEKITKCECFDILFLDIDMPQINGFEIADLVRKYNEKIIIVFLTSLDELVYESFKYKPFRFIRKEKVNEELLETMSAAINFIEEDKEKQFIFKTNLGDIKLYFKSILYAECINRKVYIKTFDMKYRLVNIQFNNLINEFENKNFILVHRTCIVNLRYIFSINKLNIILDNEEKLPVSRYRVNNVKKAFALYAE